MNKKIEKMIEGYIFKYKESLRNVRNKSCNDSTDRVAQCILIKIIPSIIEDFKILLKNIKGE